MMIVCKGKSVAGSKKNAMTASRSNPPAVPVTTPTIDVKKRRNRQAEENPGVDVGYAKKLRFTHKKILFRLVKRRRS